MARLLQMTLFPAVSEPEETTPATEFPDGRTSSESLPSDDLGAAPTPEEELDTDTDSQADETPDAEARSRALDIHQSWVVEAPAGSGKTGLLIQRFLKLLAFGGVEAPQEVLAITFTRKADAEMRQRVTQQLFAASANVPLPATAGRFLQETRRLALAVLARDRALNWGLLTHPRQLNIRTIDSLCAELAASLPMLAGAGGHYAPIEDPEPLYRAAAERTLLNMGGADASLTADLRLLLLLRDAKPADFIALLADMLRQREQWGELIPLDPKRLTDQALDLEVRPRLTHTLERLIERDLQVAAEQLGPDLVSTLAQLAAALGTCAEYKPGTNSFQRCVESSDPPEVSAVALPHWLCLVDLLVTKEGAWRSSLKSNHLGVQVTGLQKEQLLQAIEAAQQRSILFPDLAQKLCQLRLLPPASYPEDQWQVVKALCRVLRQALVELQIVFAERRQCDFAEIALAARQLFRSETPQTELLHASVGRLKHLLVDEMQDTSAGQYALFEQIAAGWDGRTQTVFFVGDPKQSIYEFRQARVERFLGLVQQRRFADLPLEPLQLTANFRSQAMLVEQFNTVFGQIFPVPDEPSSRIEEGVVPFVAAQPTRPAGTETALHWHTAFTTRRGTRCEDEEEPSAAEEETAEVQARELRGVLEDFLTRTSIGGASQGGRQPRAAVLARNRSHLAAIVRELQNDRGNGPIPFRAVDVESLSERPEILDLLSLTRALLHPADRVAWLSLLRSPLCGLSLTDLLAITGEGPEADREASVPELVQKQLDALSPAGQLLMARCWPVLAQAIRDLGRTPLSTHVERTWRSLGGNLPLRPNEQSNARRFLELLGRLEAELEPVTEAALMRRLRRLYAAPETGPAQVDLMTIHKAKGLEWELVLIPELHRRSGRNAHEFLRWLELEEPQGPTSFILAPIQGKGDEASSLSRWLGRLQSAREASEAKRLFYVACTRAREELHLFAAVTRTQNGQLEVPKAGSLLRAAWPAARDPLEATPLNPKRAGTVLQFSQPAPNKQMLVQALAAQVEDSAEPGNSVDRSALPSLPSVSRLPLTIDPMAAFHAKPGAGVFRTSISRLQSAAPFTRPEGSLAARAFGNVTHRFLAFLSDQLAKGQSSAEVSANILAWRLRIVTALRSEGLPLGAAESGATRCLAALAASVADPEGLWLLSNHPGARNEVALPVVSDDMTSFPSRLRADRTFLAGPEPRSANNSDYLWIVDYKTAEQGGRSRDEFLLDQQTKYLPQMQAYATRATAAGHDAARIRLALYFPLLPALVVLPYSAELQPKSHDVSTSGLQP